MIHPLSMKMSDLRRWAFYNVGAFMCPFTTTEHGPQGMSPSEAIAELRRGGRIRIHSPKPPGTPTIRLHVYDRMVIMTALDGWAVGAVEPMCGIDRPYLRNHLIACVGLGGTITLARS